MSQDFVKLVSSEGFEFMVDYKAACISNTIKSMLGADGTFTETSTSEVKFPDIPARVLERVCQYFYYNLDHQASSVTSLPKFGIDPQIALHLLRAADYLDT